MINNGDSRANADLAAAFLRAAAKRLDDFNFLEVSLGSQDRQSLKEEALAGLTPPSPEEIEGEPDLANIGEFERSLAAAEAFLTNFVDIVGETGSLTDLGAEFLKASDKHAIQAQLAPIEQEYPRWAAFVRLCQLEM